MRRYFVPVAIVMLLIAPHVSSHSNFTVTPTEIDLSATETSALVTLRNASQAPLRFEVTVFTWAEAEVGQRKLTPSTDVTFCPKRVDLAGGASRNIRVGINAAAARDVEQSYRLFIEELPNQSAPKTNEVALRTKIGIPVFVRPTKPVRTAVIDSVTVESGKVLTKVRNTGNLHISVDTISAKGTGSTAAATFTKEAPGWYVLPGATRVFEMPLTAAECRATTSIAVDVVGHGKTLKAAGQVSPAACATR